jgi:hypothetical protein
MCPDKELLSAYFDDEVPSPWKKTIEEHLTECRSCADAVSGYRLMKDFLHQAEAEIDTAAVKMRVGERLRAMPRMKIPLWRRRFSVSFTAALAAAALVFGAGVSMTIALRGAGIPGPDLAVGQAKPLDVTVKVKDIGQLLDILNRQHAIREVTIQLPETKNFEFRGEPIFLRETEYTRRGGR